MYIHNAADSTLVSCSESPKGNVSVFEAEGGMPRRNKGTLLGVTELNPERAKQIPRRTPFIDKTETTLMTNPGHPGHDANYTESGRCLPAR